MLRLGLGGKTREQSTAQITIARIGNFVFGSRIPRQHWLQVIRSVTFVHAAGSWPPSEVKRSADCPTPSATAVAAWSARSDDIGVAGSPPTRVSTPSSCIIVE